MSHPSARCESASPDPLEEWLSRCAPFGAEDGSRPDDRASVTRTEVHRRPSAHLHRFTVTTRGRSVNVLVKERPPSVAENFPTAPGNWALYSGPSWSPAPEFDERSSREFCALEAIDRQFSKFRDPRFRTVESYALDRAARAFAMGVLEGVSLDRLLLDTSRSKADPASAPLLRALENCGAWLARFHALEEIPDEEPGSRGEAPPVHHDSGAQMIEALEALTAGLPRSFAPTGKICTLSARVARLFESTLPPIFPIGVQHGDFWSGNVIVDHAGAVAVIDTFAAWRTPIYEDLAYFTFALKDSAARRNRGRGFVVSPEIREQEECFLRGYFGSEAIPWPTIRAFELCVLLRKWAGRGYRCAQQRGWKRVWKRARLAHQSRHFEAAARWLFEAASDSGSCEKSASLASSRSSAAPKVRSPTKETDHAE